MNLSPENTDKFIAAWLADFGEAISLEEAHEHVQRIYSLYKALADAVKSHPDKFKRLVDATV